MPEILVVRHAKAERDGAGGDRDRRLAPRGIEAADRLGRFLRSAAWQPQLVLCSPARRTVETLDRVSVAAGWTAETRVVDPLYPGDVRSAVAALGDPGQRSERVAVVGHEPWCSDLVRWLTGGTGARFPTGAAACVEVATRSWDRLGEGRGELLWMVTPKVIADPEPTI